MTFIEELNDSFPIFNDDIDPPFLLQLLYFFPMDKVNIAAGSYDQYLYDLEKTIIDNYDAGNYQVAFFHAHLLFMSFVYYCVERVYKLYPERMKDVYYPINAYSGKNDKPELENYKSIYDFSRIPEKEIFKVFRVMGMEHDQIKKISKYISERDEFAHATGKGNISEDNLIHNVSNINKYMGIISDLFLPSVKEQYIQYLLDCIEYECDSILDSAADYVLENNISIHEVTYLCNLGLRSIQDEKGLSKKVYLQLRKEHCAFIEFCIENYGIDIPEGYSALRDERYLFYRYKSNANDYIEKELGISSYECGKHGENFPVYECPECGEDQLVHNAETGCYHCFACEENFTGEDLTFCERCGSLMRRSDDIAVCDNCIENMVGE